MSIAKTANKKSVLGKAVKSPKKTVPVQPPKVEAKEQAKPVKEKTITKSVTKSVAKAKPVAAKKPEVKAPVPPPAPVTAPKAKTKPVEKAKPVEKIKAAEPVKTVEKIKAAEPVKTIEKPKVIAPVIAPVKVAKEIKKIEEVKPQVALPVVLDNANVKLLKGIGLNRALIEKSSAFWPELPNAVHLKCLPNVLDGGDIAIANLSNADRNIISVIVIAENILSNAEFRGKAGAPRVVCLLESNDELSELLVSAKPIFSQLGIKNYSHFSNYDDDGRTTKALDACPDVLFATHVGFKKLDDKKLIQPNNLSVVITSQAVQNFDESLDRLDKFVRQSNPSQNIQRLFLLSHNDSNVRKKISLQIENQKYIDVNVAEWAINNQEKQWIHAIPATDKFQVLQGLLAERKPEVALVCANTRAVAEWIAYKLIKNGIKAEPLTMMPFRSRLQVLHDKIAKKRISVVVATDVAIDSLHIPNLKEVFNFDIPEAPDNYLKRLSCLSQQAESPVIVTLLCEDYGYHMKALVETLGYMPETKNIPEAYTKIADKSDFPLDGRGRVKAIWDDRFEAETKETPTVKPVVSVPAKDKPAFTTTTLSASPKKAVELSTTTMAPPSIIAVPAAPVAAASISISASTTAEPVKTPQVPLASHTATPHKRQQAPVISTASPSYAMGKSLRRDEKARETIEAALLAAREAARNRQEQLKLPSGDVRKDVEHMMLVAKDGVAAAAKVIQQKIAVEVEDRFPIFASLVKHYWQLKKEQKK